MGEADVFQTAANRLEAEDGESGKEKGGFCQ